jgi:hypothetical protein
MPLQHAIAGTLFFEDEEEAILGSVSLETAKIVKALPPIE